MGFMVPIWRSTIFHEYLVLTECRQSLELSAKSRSDCLLPTQAV